MHNGIPAFFMILLFIGGICFVLLVVLGQQRQTTDILQRVADRFHGRLAPTQFLETPQVRLQFQGYPALLRFANVGKQTHTAFTIAWPDNALRCEVYPQDIFSGVRKLWGMEDIEIGSPQFDAAYFIAGDNRAAVRELLTSDVQAIVFRLSALSHANYFASREIQVKWAGGMLTITKPAKLATFESLQQFVSLSGLLFSAAIQSRNTGIEFVGEVRQPDTAEAQCQVCGESLGCPNGTSDLVYCASCETPHHRDCWQYFGGCSTYACGEKKCVEQPKPTRRKAS